jgi:hypothetical protein
MKKLFLCVCIALLAVSAGFAQRTTKARTYQLTVTVTPASAKVFVDGLQIKGNTISVPGGAHTVQASAPGYRDKSVSVSVSADMNMRLDLEPDLFDLVITANPRDAKLFIDGTQLKSNSVRLAPGTYNFKASAKGYIDYTQHVSLSGNQTLNIALKPDTAVLVITARENPGNGAPKGNAFGLMELWIDGSQQKMNKDRFEVESGKHILRFVSGGLSAEIEILVEAGIEYAIEPELSIKMTSKGPK